jgi:hypothetical protein
VDANQGGGKTLKNWGNYMPLRLTLSAFEESFFCRNGQRDDSASLIEGAHPERSEAMSKYAMSATSIRE